MGARAITPPAARMSNSLDCWAGVTTIRWPKLSVCLFRDSRVKNGDTPPSVSNAINWVCWTTSMLGTQMKSVGEVMAIGRTFKQALGKGMRCLETGSPTARKFRDDLIEPRLITPNPDRLGYIRSRLKAGTPKSRSTRSPRSIPGFCARCGKWWILKRRPRRVRLKARRASRFPRIQARRTFRFAAGARLERRPLAVRARRKELGVAAVFNRVDTCAAEFESFTPYLYSSYESECEAAPTTTQKSHDPGQRAQSHRSGNRIRLLLLPCVVRAAGVRRRIDHGELQSGNRLDRLRHQRPPVLRAADARRSPEHLRYRKARRRDRAVRRADAADAGAAAEGRGRSHHRHRS